MKLLRSGMSALSITILVTATPVFAQTPEERAAARAAGEAGISAFEAGNYEEAIQRFEGAERLMHAPTHLLYLARASLKLGRLVEAREYLMKISHERLPPNASKPFRDAQESADKDLAELEPRVPYVSVVVQGAGAKNVRVTRDDTVVPQPLLGVPHPVNPGQHTFKAVADGMESAPSTILLKEGARETVVLTLNRVESAPPPASSGPSESGVQAQTGFGSQEPTDPGTSKGVSGMRIGAYVSFGVAAVGAGLGTYFLVKGLNTQADSDEVFKCDPNCTAEQKAEIDRLDDDAYGQQVIGVSGLVVGGLGLATGITLLILDSNDKKTANKSFELKPVVGLGYTGISGRF